MSASYNRVVLDGVLESIRFTKHGVLFSLLVEMPARSMQRLACGAGDYVARSMVGAIPGHRLLVGGALCTNPTRISVSEATVIAGGMQIAAAAVNADVKPDRRALPEEDVTVVGHNRRLASGRVVWIKAYKRPGKTSTTASNAEARA